MLIYFLKILVYLIYFLNIDILTLNIDIVPDILGNDILSSYWKRGKHKIFIFSCIQTEAIKQMVVREGCCGGLCRTVSGSRAGCFMIMIFLGVLGVQ